MPAIKKSPKEAILLRWWSERKNDVLTIILSKMSKFRTENIRNSMIEGVEKEIEVISSKKDKSIAKLIYEVYPTHIAIYLLTVDEEYRKLGIGSSLITLVARLEERPILLINPRDDAKVIYKNMGFKPFHIKDLKNKKVREIMEYLAKDLKYSEIWWIESPKKLKPSKNFLELNKKTKIRKFFMK